MLLFVWPPDWRVLDQEVHLVFVGAEERRDPNDHLVEEHAEGPPVQGMVVSRCVNHLGREVFWGAAKGIGVFLFTGVDDLCEAEVC